MYKADKRKKSKLLVALLYKGFSFNSNSAIPDLFTLPSLHITNFCYFCNIYGITYTTLGTLRPKSPATLQLFHKRPEVYYATQRFFLHICRPNQQNIKEVFVYIAKMRNYIVFIKCLALLSISELLSICKKCPVEDTQFLDPCSFFSYRPNGRQALEISQPVVFKAHQIYVS